MLGADHWFETGSSTRLENCARSLISGLLLESQRIPTCMTTPEWQKEALEFQCETVSSACGFSLTHIHSAPLQSLRTQS
jgi:hypothetical protein